MQASLLSTTERKKDGSFLKTNRCCGATIDMMQKDFCFADALFEEYRNPAYSPIVFYVKSSLSDEYVADKLTACGIKTVNGDAIQSVTTVKEAVAVKSIELVEDSAFLQEHLALLLDSSKENNQTIILTSHKSINEMQLIGILRARLLYGVYVEL